MISFPKFKAISQKAPENNYFHNQQANSEQLGKNIRNNHLLRI
jgi:hypothetical protein